MESMSGLPGWAYPLIGVVVLIPIIWYLVTRWIVKVPSGKLALLENVFKGKQIETGRILARPNEMGLRRDYWKQGWHVVPFPLTKVKKYVEITHVAELAIITAKDGAPLPPDRKFADDPAGNATDSSQDKHNKFQDPGAFYDNGGIRGTQLRIVTNGPYFVHPELFDVKQIKRTVIQPGFVGIVTARDGKPLEPGQILGMRVQGHDHYQDAAAFIHKGGQAGPQIEQLPPGTYNINTDMFEIEELPALKVPQGKMAILIAKVGKPLPKGEVCAVTPDNDDVYTDAQLFIEKGGIQGPQTRMLGAGTTYYNPLAFDHEEVPLKEVKPGWVTARISYTGKEAPRSATPENKTILEGSATDPAATQFNTGVKELNIVEAGYRGLQKDVLSPGLYPYNQYAEKFYDWPISVSTVEWANPDARDDATSYFNQFLIQSFDGQDMRVDVRMTYRVLPEFVPAVLRAFGSPKALEQQVIHPQVENIFRNQVTKSPAINYVQSRDKEVQEAFKEAKAALAEYHVEVTALLITNLIPPPELTKILSSKSLAEQEKDMYGKKEEAQKARISFENRSAEADQQKALRLAETNIQVAENEARAVQKRAEGEAARIRAIGEADAAKTRVTGEAEAAVKLAIATSEANGYKLKVAAMGQDNFARLQITTALVGIKVPLVPEIIAGGGNGNGSGTADLVGTLLLPGLVDKFRSGAHKAPAEHSDEPTSEGPAGGAASPAAESDATKDQ